MVMGTFLLGWVFPGSFYFYFLLLTSAHSPKMCRQLQQKYKKYMFYLELVSNTSPAYHFLTWFMVLRYLLKAVARTEERLVKTSTLRTLCTASRHNRPTKLLMNTPRKCRRNNDWPLCGDNACDCACLSLRDIVVIITAILTQENIS